MRQSPELRFRIWSDVYKVLQEEAEAKQIRPVDMAVRILTRYAESKATVQAAGEPEPEQPKPTNRFTPFGS